MTFEISDAEQWSRTYLFEQLSLPWFEVNTAVDHLEEFEKLIVELRGPTGWVDVIER